MPEATYRRSEFYQDYTSWCTDNGRKPFSKGRVKELLEHNIGMGIRLIELSGYETFRGITKKLSEGSSKEASPSSLNADDLTATPDISGNIF